MNDTLFAVILHTNKTDASCVEEFASIIEPINLSTLSTPESDEVIVTLYFEDKESANIAEKRITDELPSWNNLFETTVPSVSRQTIRKENWAEIWKQYFHTFKASKRLVVKPSWEEYKPKTDEIILEIDPGMSFGTGRHGTTKACLQFIDELSEQFKNKPLLDAGCGSGILSMGASLLSYKDIDAFDYDPQATLIAKENFARIGADVSLSQEDLAEYIPKRTYPFIVANILAVILVQNAEKIVTALEKAPDARLLLSGILHEQYPELKTRFESLGLQEVETRRIDEWTSALFKRK